MGEAFPTEETWNMTEIRRDGGRETWSRLREWDKGQADSERFAAGLLHYEGYKSIDPSHPLGGPDGGKDIKCKKDGRLHTAGVYFPRGQQTFSKIKTKFNKDFESAQENEDEEFIFITNQELTLKQRGDLADIAGDTPVTIYHLERISSFLNTPSGFALRLEFLQLGMTIEEQTAFIKDRDRMFFETEPPSLDLNFADASGKLVGKTISVKTKVLKYEKGDLPNYGDTGMSFGIRISDLNGSDNREFYREQVAFEAERQLIKGFRLLVKNNGAVLLGNVSVKIEFNLSQGVMVLDNGDYPEEPRRRNDYFVRPSNLRGLLKKRRSIDVNVKSKITTAICEMYDVKPKDEVVTEDKIFFGGVESGKIILTAVVFADNLPEPATFDLTVNIFAEPYRLDIPTYLSKIDAERES